MFEFLNTLAKGGIVMIPLGVCSLAGVTVLIDRYVVLRRASSETETLARAVRACVEQGDFVGAWERARREETPIAAVFTAGLAAALSGVNPQEAMEEAALTQIPLLQRRLIVLDTVITIAPLLGLLGTVIGMISSFHILALSGTQHPAGITAGIAEALIATGTGLVIAIFSLIGFNWCQERVRIIGAEMERRAVQLGNWMAQAPPPKIEHVESKDAVSVGTY